MRQAWARQCRTWNPVPLAKWAAAVHDSTGVSQKIKHRTTIRCSSHTSGPIPQRTGHHLASGHLRSQQHCAQSLTGRPPGVHQPPPMTGRTKRSCYPANRSKDDLTPATTWVNPDDITLRDVSRHQTQILCGIPFYAVQEQPSSDTESGQGHQRLGSGWRVSTLQDRVPAWEDETDP